MKLRCGAIPLTDLTAPVRTGVLGCQGAIRQLAKRAKEALNHDG